MKAAFTACILAVVAIAAHAAPTLNEGIPDVSVDDVTTGIQREKRSHYGPQLYSPCAAASVPLPAAPSYQLNLAPVHSGYGVPHTSYGYGGAHYRADVGDEQEMMNFSDLDQFNTVEHAPMARAYGAVHEAPLNHYGGGANYGAGGYAHYGPAYGVFPHANTGGCNVPLLLSCSPSVVSGKLIHSHGYGGYGGGGGGSLAIGGGLGGLGGGSVAMVAPTGDDAYREVVETQPHPDIHKEPAEESPVQKQPTHEGSH